MVESIFNAGTETKLSTEFSTVIRSISPWRFSSWSSRQRKMRTWPVMGTGSASLAGCSPVQKSFSSVVMRGEVGLVIDPGHAAQAEEAVALFLQPDQRLVGEAVRGGDDLMALDDHAALVNLVLASFPRLDVVVGFAADFDMDDGVFPARKRRSRGRPGCFSAVVTAGASKGQDNASAAPRASGMKRDRFIRRLGAGS